MKIGIGSQNKTKIQAVKSACTKLKNTFPDSCANDFELIPIATQTPIPDMPLSQEQIIDGAIYRAHFVFEQLNNVDLAIGLEGGTFPITSPALGSTVHYFLQNWVYVFDGEKGFLGASPALPLPAKIVKALYEQRLELAQVIDAFSGQQDVRSNQGAFGILTNDLITRTFSFEVAVINALIPFFNQDFRDS